MGSSLNDEIWLILLRSSACNSLTRPQEESQVLSQPVSQKEESKSAEKATGKDAP
jgi:hypothetical protein